MDSLPFFSGGEEAATPHTLLLLLLYGTPTPYTRPVRDIEEIEVRLRGLLYSTVVFTLCSSE